MIERKRGQDFSSAGPIKRKLCVFVLQVQLGALQPAHSPSLLLLSHFFPLLPSMVVFTRLLVSALSVWVFFSHGGSGQRQDALFGGTHT